MPPVVIAAAITGAVGVASMVNQNAQNKAAIKNNENQQASSVGNAKNATANANAANQNWQASNPNPTNAAIAPVPPGAPGSAAHMAEMQKWMPAAQAISPLITKALAQGQAQGQTPPPQAAGAAPQPVNRAAIMQGATP